MSRWATATLVTLCVSLALPPSPLASQERDDWVVAPDPDVEIGVVDGNPNLVFASVRSARLLQDGRIVVADDGKSTVRIFGPGGEFRTRMGAKGEGPGEFEAIFGMWVVPPDTLRVWDVGLRRLTTYLADGTLVDTQNIGATPPGAPYGNLDVPVGDFSGGDVALAWTVGKVTPAEEYRSDRVVLGRFGPEGGAVGVLGEAKGFLRWGGSPVLFTPYPHATVLRDSVFFTNGVDPEIRVFGPGGGGVARTLDLPLARVDGEAAWSALEATLEGRDGGSSLEALRARKRAERTPALGGLFADDRGFLWAKVYDPTADPVYLDGIPWGPGGTWWVLTPGGEPVAKVAMPEDTVPLDVRGDRLLGLTRGPLDVERIVVHEIDR